MDKEEQKINDSISRLTALFPEIGVEGRKYSEMSNEEWKAKNTFNSLLRDKEKFKLDRQSITRERSRYIDSPVLSDAEGNLFIIHGTDVTDTSRMQLTKVNFDGRTFTETWTVKLADFYRDPEKADDKGAFETVFSDGNPNFRYQWFDIADNKLFMISQLRMICIDVETGKTLWEHPL
jgi:outer membrane protein assembly factor BamB